MRNIEYARPQRKVQARSRWLFPVYAVLGIAVVSNVILYVSISQTPAQPPPSAGPTGITALTTAINSNNNKPKFDAMAVFNERVQPVLEQLHMRDVGACQRAIARIHAHFDAARGGAPRFADAIIGPLNGVKTTWLAGKGTFERWWYDDSTIQPVADHVRWNYEQNITSGPKIRDAIVDSIRQLEQDFRVNRNESLQAIQSNLSAADLPAAIEIDQKQLDEFSQQQFESAIEDINRDRVAEVAAGRSAAAFAVSTAAMIIAERAIAYVLTEEVLAAGGWTAVLAGTGAGAGSEVPGLGNVAGATAGLLAGIGVDYWMSHKNKQRTIGVVTASLTQVENRILHGDQQRPGGIQAIYDEAAVQQVQQLAKKLRAQFEEAAK